MEYWVTLAGYLLTFISAVLVAWLKIKSDEKKAKAEIESSNKRNINEFKAEQTKVMQEFKTNIEGKIDEMNKNITQNYGDLQKEVGEMKAVNQETMAVLHEKLEEQNRRISAHNNVIERTYNLEKLSVQFAEIQKSADAKMEEMKISQSEIVKSVGRLQDKVLDFTMAFAKQ